MGTITRCNAILLLGLTILATSAGGQQTERSTRTILVAGATGTQGGAVARELNRRGYRVRGLTRDPTSERALALVALGIEMVRGDFDDAASLDAALQNAYGAFSVQQYRGLDAGGELRHGRAFADAAERTGVQHFVYTSVAKARLNTGVPQYDSKVPIEDHIRAIGIAYTIIRPSTFMTWIDAHREDILAGFFSAPFPPEKQRVYISPGDIGRFAAEAFDDPLSWVGKELSIGGERISSTAIAEVLSRVTGRTVVYRQMPWEEFAASAPPNVLASSTWYMTGNDPMDLDALHQEFPWLRTFERYLIETGW